MGKKKGKKTGGQATFNIGSKLSNIQTLVATGRRKEAIAYMFMIYTMICGAKFKVGKKPSQSIRDFAMIMVQQHGQNPTNVYPFVQTIESVIYGGKQPSEEAYRGVRQTFAKVFEDVVGKPLPNK